MIDLHKQMVKYFNCNYIAQLKYLLRLF